MKFFLLFLAVLPLLASAQIGKIQTQEKPYEFIGRIIFHDKNTDVYYLHVQSDNQFESKIVRLKLGKTPTEAAQSIANLYATLQNSGQQFNIGNYTFVVYSDWRIYIQKKGDLYYAAGDYDLSKWEMQDAVRELITKYEVPIGKVTIIAQNLVEGKMDIVCEDYGMTFTIDVKKDVRPMLNNVYKSGQTLIDIDACALHQAVLNGKIENSFLLRICMD